MTELRPEGRRFWVMPEMLRYGADGLPNPNFNVEETSKMWFGMSGSWLRFRMRPDKDKGRPLSWLVLDGQPIEVQRKDPNNRKSHRVFSLANFEPMAWSLHGFEMADIDKARSELRAKQAVELAELTTRQEQELLLERNQTERMRVQLAERHPRQRDQLAEKHAAQVQALDDRRDAADRRLAATIALVRAEAALYGILPVEDALCEPVAA